MARRRRSIAALCFLVTAIGPAIPASGFESVVYKYDSRGRLVRVERSGGANNGIVTNYSFDRADNRTTVTTTLPAPGFHIGDATAVEGALLSFTVTRAGPTGTASSVNFATAGGTATSGSDFAALTGTLDFQPSQTSKTITVSTVDDSSQESAETMVVVLSNASGGVAIVDNSGTGTLTDNDAPNQPPTPVADTANLGRCLAGVGINLVNNDTDPENDIPLTLVSISGGSGIASAQKMSDTSVEVETFGQNGTEIFWYVLQDSRGATANGQLTVNVSGTVNCDLLQTPPPESEE